MKRVLLHSAIKLNRERKYRKGWQKVVSVLSAIVVFCTTYALILPAITMERDTVCGLEAHEHSASCFQQTVTRLDCALEISEGSTVVHTHDSVCYDADGVLWCQLPEIAAHVHDDQCYQITEIPCAHLEEEGHTCTEECVTTQTEQICTVTEEFTHQHDETCVVKTEEVSDVPTCGLDAHIHEDACYPLEEADAVDSAYLCGSGAHTHSEACQGEGECSIPEHTHEAACMVAGLDLTADVETAADWEKTFADVELTGSWPADVLAVAETQLGYRESEKNCVLVDDDLKGYTRYGAWYGIPYGDWCAMFASFCLDYAGVEEFPLECGCAKWIEALEEEELYAAVGTYEPKPGDLIFFDYDLRRNGDSEIEADHVGIVVELIEATEDTPAQIRTLEGNTGDKVDYVTYDLDDAAIIGYGVLPEQMYYCGLKLHTHDDSCLDESGAAVCGREAHTHSEGCGEPDDDYFTSTLPLICTTAAHTHTADCYDGDDGSLSCEQAEHRHGAECYEAAEADFTYEDDRVSMTVHVTSYIGIPEGTSMKVTQLDDDSDAYWNYADYAAEEELGELFDLMGYQISFYLAGEEIALADAEITAELTIKPVEYTPVQTFSLMALFASEEEEEDQNVLVQVLQDEDGNVSENGSVTFTGEDDGSSSMMLALGASRTLALAARSVPNPAFTVEFYANIPSYVYYEEEPANHLSLQIIDTRGAGDGTGGNLPQNSDGKQVSTMYLGLIQTAKVTDQMSQNFISSTSGASQYIFDVMTELKLTQVYTDENHTYASGMTVMNVDKLHGNKSYQLSQIWVSEDGETWTKYTEEAGVEGTVQVDSLHALQFTNGTGDGTNLALKDGYHVRMVYDVTTGTRDISANIFDYDITDTNVYLRTNSGRLTYSSAGQAISNLYRTSYKTLYMNAYQYGINAASAYVTSGGTAQFSFGNQNTGVANRLDTLNGYYINGGNSNTFKTCSFGLVTGYDIENDILKYATGIDHQALFNDEAYYGGSVSGKTTYSDQTLNFVRTGDSYVLTSVNGGSSSSGISENQLDEFILPGYAWNTTIPQFANNFWPLDGTTSNSTTNHDMEFGDFDEAQNRGYILKDGSSTSYVGLPNSDDGEPHNSYFGMQYSVEFKLDGHYCGPLEYLFYGDDDMWVFLTDLETNKSQLVCDIGGVHGSVGSFTDLWDYIPKDSEGSYRLTFFYTERGATGSSCYMEFTLPEVTSITQNTPDTGSVSVTKDVEGTTVTGETFEFLFSLSASDTGSTSGLYDSFGCKVTDASGTTIRTGVIASGETFTLADGETMTIVGIPEGLNYTITEQLAEEQRNNYNIAWTGTADAAGKSVSGTIVGNKSHSYTCTNSSAGTLNLTKEIVGTATDAEFTFVVTLTNADGTPLSGTFGSHTIGENGVLEVVVKQNETVSLTNLPTGTKWTVTEAAVDGYDVTYKVDGTVVTAPSGTVAHGETVTVTVVNATQYALPNTGGMGTASIYTFGGLLILAAALMYCCSDGYKRRKGGR